VNATAIGIDVYGNGYDVTDVAINGNVLKGGAGTGISVRASAGKTATLCTIEGNIMRTSAVGTTGIVGTNTNYLLVIGNITDFDTATNLAGANNVADHNIAY